MSFLKQGGLSCHSRAWLDGLAQGQWLWLKAVPAFPGIFLKKWKNGLAGPRSMQPPQF